MAGLAWRVAVVFALLAGVHVSCGRREQRAGLMLAARASFRYYPGSGDAVKISDCRIGKISRKDVVWLQNKFGGVYPYGGTCRVELVFRDHPKKDRETRQRLTARYGWAPSSPEYIRGWMPLPFEFEDPTEL